MAALAPVNVSPLIKGARWTLLVAGMLYGTARYNMLCRKERKRLNELERTRPEREAREAEARQRAREEELRAIEELSKPSKPVAQV